MVIGTVDYMAPEQARRDQVDGRADVYALGVLLYRLLRGRLPFEADSLAEMIHKHAHEEPRPLESAAPHVPPEVCRIVARMMAKELGDRPSNPKSVT